MMSVVLLDNLWNPVIKFLKCTKQKVEERGCQYPMKSSMLKDSTAHDLQPLLILRCQFRDKRGVYSM